MSNTITWLVFAVGYVPIHFLLPVMVGFMTGDESPAQRKALLRTIILEGLVSLSVLGVAVMLLFKPYPMLVLLLLLIAPMASILGIWRYRKRHGHRWKGTPIVRGKL